MKRTNLTLLMCALALVFACKGKQSPVAPPPPAPVTPSSSSIQKAINTLVSGVTTAMNTTRSGKKSLDSASIDVSKGFLPDLQSFTTQCNASGTSCSTQFNEPYAQQTNCANGGSTTVTGTMTGVLQSSANSTSGTLNMSTRSWYAECSEGGWVTNTNPSIGSNIQIFVTTNRTRINITMSGGFIMKNAPGQPNGGTTCVFNGVLLQWDDITGNWANSGSVDCNPGGSFRFN